MSHGETSFKEKPATHKGAAGYGSCGWFGIWEFFFGDAKDKCFHKAVKWLDNASDEEQNLLFTVYFLAGDTPVTGAERNRELVHKFLDHIKSLQPEVSQKDANFMADVVIKGA